MIIKKYTEEDYLTTSFLVIKSRIKCRIITDCNRYYFQNKNKIIITVGLNIFDKIYDELIYLSKSYILTVNGVNNSYELYLNTELDDDLVLIGDEIETKNHLNILQRKEKLKELQKYD